MLDSSQEAFGHMNWRKEWKHIWESLRLCPTVHICDSAHSYALSPLAKPLFETEHEDQAIQSQLTVESFKFSKTPDNRSFKPEITPSIATGQSHLLCMHNLRYTDKGLWSHKNNKATAPPARIIQIVLGALKVCFNIIQFNLIALITLI